MTARRKKTTTPRKTAPPTARTAVQEPGPPEPSPVIEGEPVAGEGVTAQQLMDAMGAVDDEGVPLISKEITLRGRTGGSLTLKPFQDKLDEIQTAALVSIGIDVDGDPGIKPHVRPFIHLCQARGLDPWLKEAYLIGRGRAGDKKYVMQVGIDGYLKMAKGTRRFRRISQVLWTPADDAPDSWYFDPQTHIQHRVWFDQWPESKGNPGSARVVIEHWDEYGVLTETDAIADWAMYAPYVPVYEGTYPNKRKKVVDGKIVMELGDFWRKGAAHMLAKCATALAIRKAFPGATAGVLTTEEMHQADAIEMQRVDAQRIEGMQTRIAERRAQGADRPASDTPPTDDEAALLGDTAAAEPLLPPLVEPSGPEKVEAERVERPKVYDEDTKRAWLLEELALMSEIIGQPVAALTRRWAVGAKKNVDDPSVPITKLQQLVAGLRPMTIQMLRELPDRVEEADAYAQVAPEDCGPNAWLLGLGPREPAAEEPLEGEIVGVDDQPDQDGDGE